MQIRQRLKVFLELQDRVLNSVLECVRLRPALNDQLGDLFRHFQQRLELL